ncbi:membrane protein [Agarivorans sp. Toyoura001]|uniref:YqaA family protein n=1 Tax=Agarivorans sp. Toyoura001 TaxID=2283141 RepID=UPI0010D90376|nr:YqaA family protein [Agarivorans sp. Toyoura001]GDY24402.1 membrane protein [Agarivorans sp. Toyoura001]
MLALLFFSAFVSATLLPGSSEVLLLGLVSQVPEQWISLLVVASIGNTIGGLVTFAMGWGSFNYGNRHFTWLPNLSEQAKAKPWLTKYGAWSLLMSWAPVIGDALCFVAGAAKLSVWQSTIAMLIGKTIRYALLIWLGSSVANL